MHERCTGTNKDGAPCGAQAWRDGLCRWHHPDLAGARAGWRAKGGEHRSNAARARKALPQDLADVRDALLRVLVGLEEGDVDPRRATAMAAVARAVCHVQEVGDLERRLATIEEELKREQEAQARWPTYNS